MQDVRMGDVKEDATTIGLVEKPKTKAKTVCAGKVHLNHDLRI
jgi:hypothetical protein